MGLCGPSDSALFIVPDHLAPERLLRGISDAGNLPGAGCIVSGFSLRDDLVSLSLGEAESVQQAINLVKHASPKRWLLVDLTGALGRWSDSKNGVSEFHAACLKLARQSKVRVICVAARRFVSQELRAEFSATYDLLVELFARGAWTYAQIRSLDGCDQPEAFLPRPVRWLKQGFKLGPPALSVPGSDDTTADASVELYRSAFLSSPDGVVLFDQDGTFRECNSRCAELLGIAQSDFPSIALLDLVEPSSRLTTLRLLAELRRKGRGSGDILLLARNGKTIPVSCTTVAHGAHLSIASMRSVGPDRRAPGTSKQGILESTELGRAIPLPQAIVAGRKIVEANSAFREKFASVFATNEEPSLASVFGQQVASSLRQLLAVAEESGPSEKRIADLHVKIPDGAVMECEVVSSRVTRGAKRAALLTFIDNTERNLRLRTSHESERMLRSIIDVEANPAIVVRGGEIIWAGRGTAALLGYGSPEHLMGKPVTLILAQRDQGSVPNKLEATSEEAGVLKSFEFSAVNLSGKVVRLESTTERIEFQGSPAGLSVLRNISGKGKSVQELRQRLDELGALEKIRASLPLTAQPNEFCRIAVESAQKHLGMDGGVFLIIDDRDRSVIRPGAAAGVTEELSGFLAGQSALEGFFGYLTKTLQHLHLNLDQYPAYLPNKGAFEKDGYSTIVCLPIAEQERLTAVILLFSKKRIDVTDVSEHFFEMVEDVYREGFRATYAHHGLARSLSLYRRAVEQTTAIHYELFANGSVEYVGPQIMALTGYSPQEFLADADLWRRAVHPDDRSTYSGRMAGQSGGESAGALQYRILPKGKAEYRTVRDSFTWRKASDGSFEGISGVVTEIESTSDPRPQSVAKPPKHDYHQALSTLSTLAELGRKLIGVRSSSEILDLVAREFADRPGFESLVFCNTEPVTETSQVLLARNGEARFEDAPEEDRALAKEMIEEWRSAGGGEPADVESDSFIVRIPGKSNLHGVFAFKSDAGDYSAADLRLADSIAILTGIAMDRALLNEEAVGQAEELLRRNRDLDDFTYVVSHDLKEPLITIEGYSTLLRREYGEKLGADAAEFLGLIVHASERMKHLIDDLLMLSRVGRTATDSEPVNTTEVVQGVLRDLDYSIREKKAAVIVPSDLPMVRYNQTHLGLVFRNLLSNGIKFNRSEAPLVEVLLEDEGAEFRFGVKDNGIGIPAEFKDRVFVIFQRLHPSDEFPGTGAGLTIMKKIVERHGGRVWIDSAPDAGTTVYFTIPK
jgi:PAS domain S-box-containing protein